jgi:hypothetical protein
MGERGRTEGYQRPRSFSAGCQAPQRRRRLGCYVGGTEADGTDASSLRRESGRGAPSTVVALRSQRHVASSVDLSARLPVTDYEPVVSVDLVGDSPSPEEPVDDLCLRRLSDATGMEGEVEDVSVSLDVAREGVAQETLAASEVGRIVEADADHSPPCRSTIECLPESMGGKRES